jgi:hypothetical protein
VIRIEFDLNLADVIEINQLIAAIPVEMDGIIISAILKSRTLLLLKILSINAL